MFQHPGASARMGRVLRLEGPSANCRLCPRTVKVCALLTAHGGGPCFQDPGQSLGSACLFPGGGSCIAGGARKVVLPGLTGLGAVGACLSGSLPGTTARRPPCACLPSTPVGAPCVCPGLHT